jgi:tetratricopeptide (TPR) repeat protein
MRKFFKMTLAAAALCGVAFGLSGQSWADGSDSGGGSGAGKCSQFKKGSSEWKKCMAKHLEEREDAYALGYWLAKTGAYQEALNVLHDAGGENDPRILTMIGYATRNLGKVEEAIGYYHQALALNNNMTNTRQYLGEAFLQKGEPALAREQLAEIRARCGDACEDYRNLASAITVYEAAKAVKG